MQSALKRNRIDLVWQQLTVAVLNLKKPIEADLFFYKKLMSIMMFL